MSDEMREDVTTILEELHTAEDKEARKSAEDRLFELVYEELRLTAEQLMRKERPDHTLQPTALVNEAILRLLEADVLAETRSRHHLRAIAARAMEHILCDHARKRRRLKRGGSEEQRGERVELDQLAEPPREQSPDVLALQEQLDELAKDRPRQSKILRLRYHGRMTMEEIAEHLEVSKSTVEVEYRAARAWLYGKLKEDNS